MEELIRQYLTEHLAINIKEESYGFNGNNVTIELKLDEEVISSASYTINQDEG